MGKRYDDELKLRAARQVVLEGMTYESVSANLGALAWSIRGWVKKFRESGELPPAGCPS